MTQTLPTTAIVGRSFFTGLVGLTTLPMTSVELAREEFGASLADAQAFVLNTCCTGCGQSAEEAKECRSCGVQLCDCALFTEHDNEQACTDCYRPCYGRCCYED